MENSVHTLLIVDDDPRNVFALKATLKARKYTVITSTSAVEALDILNRDKSIDMVLLDMMMPEMDGYEALASLRGNPEFEHLPVIAVTAQAMTGDREKCLEAGASAYLSKPIDVDKLVILLDQFLES
ncbi:MAG: response regulator [Bacteroidota bacterium]